MSRGHLLIHIFILSFLLHIHILLHLCCGIRDFAAQLDLLPLGADLFVVQAAHKYPLFLL